MDKIEKENTQAKLHYTLLLEKIFLSTEKLNWTKENTALCNAIPPDVRQNQPQPREIFHETPPPPSPTVCHLILQGKSLKDIVVRAKNEAFRTSSSANCRSHAGPSAFFQLVLLEGDQRGRCDMGMQKQQQTVHTHQ